MANFPSLTATPKSIVEEQEDSVLRSEFEGGYEYTRARYTRNRKTYTMEYIMPSTDINVLSGFYSTSIGHGADSFGWTHPLDSSTHTVRFTEPLKFQTIIELPNYYEITITLREV